MKLMYGTHVHVTRVHGTLSLRPLCETHACTPCASTSLAHTCLYVRRYDTGSNSKGSIMAYRAARADNFDGTDYSLHSIIGAARSDASKPMATLGAIDGVPQSSYWSTSDSLDDKGNYSYFSRTIPADLAVAKAEAEFVKFQGHTKSGIAHVNDPYGSSWEEAFVMYCR